MPAVEAIGDDPQELRRSLRELVAVSMLPAVWREYDAHQPNGRRVPAGRACLTRRRRLPMPRRSSLGDSLTVELSALDRAVLVRIQVPQPAK